MKLKSVQRTPLVEVVVEKLRESIQRGRFGRGQRLPSEPELVQQLGVSRTVLREAINRLQTVGLVTIKRGVGTYVADPDDLANCARLLRTAMALSSDELVRFVELREAIESHAARQAAARATPEDVAELASLCGRMEDEEETDEQAMRLDLQFHLCLVKITGNRLMQSVLEMLQEFIVEGMLRTTPRPRQRSFSRRAHLAIVDAIRNHDSEAAAVAVGDHMNLLVRRLQEDHKLGRRKSPRKE
jgi:GntR family transcriptional regulator, transcriptional repressor for pyruvate dehydrogenase complex